MSRQSLGVTAVDNREKDTTYNTSVPRAQGVSSVKTIVELLNDVNDSKWETDLPLEFDDRPV